MAKSKSYGQFCPVAQAAEIVAERWTPLVLRELILGSRRFNDLRKGVPLMSPTLLSQRLKELEAAGVVEHDGADYRLSPAGEELKPVIEGLGLWGLKHIKRKLRPEEREPSLLMWDIRRMVDVGAMPGGRRTVVEFEIGGVPAKKSLWWLVFDDGEVDLCLKDPGYEIDLRVASQMQSLADVWLGRTPLRGALRSGAIRLDGARQFVRGFADWFTLSSFAKGPAPARSAPAAPARPA